MSASHDIEETEAIHLGIAIKEECDLWRADLEMADHEGGFFASLGMVLVTGQKTV